MLSENRTGLKLFLYLLAIVFLLPGCAASQGPDDTGGDELSGPREGDQAPQTTMMVAGSEPPGTTLSYGGETVEGGLGTYCWTAGGAGACADAVGILLEGGALKAPAGATLSFAYKGRELDSLGVGAYRAGREGEGGGREDDVFVPPYRGDGGAKSLNVRRSGTRASIAADLPAGEYVLDAFATMPEGDASYGFRLTVREPGTAAGDPPAFAAVRFEPALLVGEVRRMAGEHGVEGGMVEGQYRVGGEVYGWMSTGGLGADFEKERLASFADLTSDAGQMTPGGESPSPETSAMRKAVEEGEAGPIEISSIEFYGPESVLEELVREEKARISQASVTTDAQMRETLRNVPKGCCN